MWITVSSKSSNNNSNSFLSDDGSGSYGAAGLSERSSFPAARWSTSFGQVRDETLRYLIESARFLFFFAQFLEFNEEDSIAVV